jgi:TonB-dependent SusC/RagA subfamily outer membrane receptor
MASTDPLFVVNGQTIGTDYSQVHGMVHPNDVVSMTVLKGSDATIYGSRGANGVIVIRTK